MEAKQINFLRAYSNYLTPRLGFLSADVWAAVAIYLRNLLLNLAILVLALSAVLLLPKVWLVILLEIANYVGKTHGGASLRLVFAVGALFLLAITTASWNIASHAFPGLLDNRFTKQKWVLILIVFPLFVAAPLGTIALWLAVPNLTGMRFGSWALWGCLVYGLVRSAGLLFSGLWLRYGRSSPIGGWWSQTKEALWIVMWAFAAGPLGGMLAGWIEQKFSAWAPLLPSFPPPQPWGIAKVAFWGVPLLIGALLLTGVLHIGLMSRPFTFGKWVSPQFSNEKREWWGRMNGWLLICCLCSVALFGLGIYAPLGVGLLGGYVKTKAALIGGWILSTVGGLLAGKSGSTSGTTGTDSKLEIVGKVAPYIFVVGLLVALSCGVHSITTLLAKGTASEAPAKEYSVHVYGELDVVAKESSLAQGALPTDLKLAFSVKPPFNTETIKTTFWKQICASATNLGTASLLFALLVLAAASLLLSTRADINEFSMHLFYRNRLVRCYLGASNDNRKPQEFSGFDPKDDTFLKDFSVTAAPYLHEDRDRAKEELIEYAGPYPILNCTLTVTHGERLAWQERKGESFVFTPRYCGYEFQEQSPIERSYLRHLLDQTIGLKHFQETERGRQPEDNGKPGGYRETGGYAYPPDGIYLGTALATSGAAVNPNMGFHTSSALAFLMTVFNVRLGWWLGNPRRRETRGRATPRLGMFYLLMELFALTSDRSRYVNLSDGFHFENLGLYELVRRRCKYIIVGDAGADPEHSFDDLANAIRKCRTDFGIEIEIDLTGLQLDKEKKFSSAHAAAGLIRYDLIEPDAEKGILIYFKPTLTEDDSADIQNYRTSHPVFPHQSTANQWFDESQFESYRQLGRISAETVLKLAGTPDELRSKTTSEVFETLSTLL